MLKVNSPAPDFTLPDQNGKTHKLSDYIGSTVLVYFYPKDSTPGCTVEACTIRDVWSDFLAAGIVVLGISTDSIASHEKFATKHNLPFTILADENKEVVNLYGVYGKKKFLGREYMGTNRNSFLIDKKGNIAKIYEKVKPADHAEEVLKDAKEL